jgi:stage II sporulation protein E
MRRRAFFVEAASFALALLFGRVKIFQGLQPFGVALFVAMDMAGYNVYYPLAGALCGALFALPAGLAALCRSAFYIAARLICKLARKKVRRADKLLLLVLCELIALILFYLGGLNAFLQGLAGIALTLLFCLAYQQGLRGVRGMDGVHSTDGVCGIQGGKRLTEQEQVALCIVLGTLALALSDVRAYAFSLGVVIVVWAAMFIAYARGMPAVAAAVALGGMLVLGGGASPMLLTDMAVCTLCAVLLRRVGGAWGAACGFLVCCAITERYIGVNGHYVGLVNAIPAALGVMLPPKRALLYLRAMVDMSAKDERTARTVLKRMQARAARGLTNTANTVERVAELFQTEPEWTHNADEERARMRRAAQNLCGDCSHRSACWKMPEDTLNAIEAMLPSYAMGRRPRPQKPIDCTCNRAGVIAAAAAAEQDAYHRQCALYFYQESRQAFAHRQINGIGRVMHALSRDMLGEAWPDENASEALRRNLERAGIPVRGALVQRNESGMYIELRAQPFEIEPAAVEEIVSRAVERPMRLFRAQTLMRQSVLEFEQAGALKAAAGTASLPMEGSDVCGDSTGYTGFLGGMALFALSDGMGTGVDAQKQSAQAIQLLIKLYEAGFTRDTALECVNRLLVKLGEQDMYATVDALHVNLNDGEAEFIKFGAPPSFVLRNARVHTIYAEAPPAGILDEAAPAVNMAALKRNDAVVLLTDGALEALGGDIAQEIIRCVGGANTCEEAARALLNAARERNADDDMTVLVVRME